MNITALIPDNRTYIPPDSPLLVYSGRIDFEDTKAPLFIFPYSMVNASFTGTSLQIAVINHHQYWDNYLGYIIDGEQEKILLPNHDSPVLLTLAEDLDDGPHTVTLFKRMDACHYITLLGLILSNEGRLLQAKPKPARRMEFYGDSVTAGEVSEALDYIGQTDPVHNGEYSNSWYSYASITARRLHAEAHIIAQGGIALLNGTGWFNGPEYPGMEYAYSKLSYNRQLGAAKEWDFTRYTPHVVIVALGQNDSHPEDYMKEAYSGQKSIRWRDHYHTFLLSLRSLYPNAVIILATTILCHDASWDRAVDTVCRELNDPGIHHFVYSRNGCGTPGHIRTPEAEEMAAELSAYIEAMGSDIWSDSPDLFQYS